MSRRIVIVRHGNTFGSGEIPRRIGRATDVPLTETGREQARVLGTHFKDRRFASILSGPLLRTRETARLIAGPVTVADWLEEIDHGRDEGLPEPEVEARIGRAALDAWDHHAIPPDGWRVDAAKRTAAWGRLLTAPGGDTLVVTSNGAARFALVAIGARPEAGMKLATGAWGEIAIDETGKPELLCWNVRPPSQ